MNTTNQPLVSIITLNYNQTRVTCEFLESLKSLTYENFEVIVVDNASKKNPALYFKETFPPAKVIRCQENLGFTGGNNVGILAARGAYLLIINNDTEVTDNLLEKMLEPFEMDSTIGIVSPKIRYFFNPDTIQYAGYTSINPYTGRNLAIGKKEKDEGQYDQPSYTNYGHGAAMMVKRKAIYEAGPLADVFFIYYEELDWSQRIKNAGFKIYYQPEALLYHKESMTVGKESPMKAYYHTRNRILFMRRHSKPHEFLFFMMFYMSLVLPKNLLRYIINFQAPHLKAFFRALSWNLKSYNKRPEVIWQKLIKAKNL